MASKQQQAEDAARKSNKSGFAKRYVACIRRWRWLVIALWVVIGIVSAVLTPQFFAQLSPILKPSSGSRAAFGKQKQKQTQE